jgi:hypothetical protein
VPRGGTPGDQLEPAAEMRILGPLHAESVVVARPWKHRDVRDRIVRAAEIEAKR